MRFSTILLLLPACGLTASLPSPVIQSNNFAVIGDVFSGVNAKTDGGQFDSIVPPGPGNSGYWGVGPSGADVVWNFNWLQEQNPETLSYVAPASTPKGASFPNANIAEKGSWGFTYMNISSQQLQIVGTDYGDTIPYSAPHPFMNFPSTYLDTVPGWARAVYRHAGNTIRRNQYTRSIGDGYGTLVLPGATYQNVLRLRIDVYTVDSTFADTGFVERSNYVTWEYVFLSPTLRPFALYLQAQYVYGNGGNSSTSKTALYLQNPAGPVSIAPRIRSRALRVETAYFSGRIFGARDLRGRALRIARPLSP